MNLGAVSSVDFRVSFVASSINILSIIYNIIEYKVVDPLCNITHYKSSESINCVIADGLVQISSKQNSED